ncbi:MAG: ABC transporter ATP-binding protein [Bacteroidota bacterium]
MKNIKWMLSYVKPYWKQSVTNVFFNILSVIFSLFSLTMVVPFLNLLFGKQELVLTKPIFQLSADSIVEYFNYYLSTIINEQGKSSALLYFCLLVASLFFLKNLFRYLAVYFFATVRNGLSRDLRDDLYKKVTGLNLAFFTRERKGDIISRMTSDVQEVEWTILSSIEAVFKEPFTIILSLVTLVIMSPKLTLFILIMLPVSGFIIGSTGKALKKAATEGQRRMGVMLSMIEETLSGIRIIKAFTAELFTIKRFMNYNNDYNKLMVKMYRRRDLASPMSEFLGTVVVVIVMWFGGQMVLAGDNDLTASVFIGYIVVFSQIISPAKAFTTAYYNLQKGLASAERIQTILNTDNPIKESQTAKSHSEFTSSIEFKNVSFAYNNYNEDLILKGINLTVTKGKTVALVGQSGAGKTTLADLIPRFYDVIDGDIFIDGISLKEIKMTDLRSLMGIVTQESILFNDTVYNNIVFGNESVSKDDVIRAAKIANAHEFIEQLENGYDTNIGDRGGKLSGGQRQRISIARAVLKNPPILILDEATSALDSESERLVQDALNKLMQNRTSVIIAHRLSTIMHADEIVVMQKGEIVERGSHQQLLNQNGTYKKLHDMQAFL